MASCRVSPSVARPLVFKVPFDRIFLLMVSPRKRLLSPEDRAGGAEEVRIHMVISLRKLKCSSIYLV